MLNPADRIELVLPSKDLTADMAFFESIGFRLDQIYPSDDPAVARMSGLGMKLRLDRNSEAKPSVLNLLTRDTKTRRMIAPNGTVVNVQPAAYTLQMPPTVHRFEVRRLKDSAPWVIGRAGMQYRDLIPDRLGGSIIASHIRIPEAGPVPDVVHYHTIGFQLIYCHKGWVRLVYEDQGPPFVLKAGDCVTQPPQIRHRVLEASENLEVVEIGVPAEHMTTIDHEMELPTQVLRPEREFDSQVFCHHQADGAAWQEDTGYQFQDTGILKATRGVADVRVMRIAAMHEEVDLTHATDINFTFVLSGGVELRVVDGPVRLKEGDAFVVPPHSSYQLVAASSGCKLLQVRIA